LDRFLAIDNTVRLRDLPPTTLRIVSIDDKRFIYPLFGGPGVRRTGVEEARPPRNLDLADIAHHCAKPREFANGWCWHYIRNPGRMIGGSSCGRAF
jgi:hypothetical protein